MTILDVYTKEGMKDRNLISLIVYNEMFNKLPRTEIEKINELMRRGTKLKEAI
jgi:hypothetical protein